MDLLVDFARPPVVETVLSVGFAPLHGLTGAHVGEFWAGLREDFPNVAEQPPYGMPVEKSDGPPGLSLTVTSVPPSRYWLISGDDSRLIQVQRDWFAFNWRYRNGKPYSSARYPTRRQMFEEYWIRFKEYIESNKLGAIEPTACEVTYINHVQSFGDADSVYKTLGFFSKPQFSPDVGRIENWETSLSVVMRPEQRAIGRLHISVRPIRHSDEPVLQIDLTARGAPLGKGDEGIMHFLDKGHEAIVVNFEAITTDEMHKEWGLR